MRSARESLDRGLFRRVQQKGAHVKSAHIDARGLPHSNNRISVVVSKKLSAEAHKRNQIRRRVYHQAVRLLRKRKDPLAVVLFVRPGADKISMENLIFELTKSLDTGYNSNR